MNNSTLPEKFMVKLNYGSKVHIKALDKKYIISESGESYDEFQLAYDAAHKYDKSALVFFNVQEIVNSDPARFESAFMTILDSVTRRMFFSYDEKEYQDSLLGDWLYFKKVAKKYKKDKKNFYKAYNFLTGHPLFWRLEGDVEKTGRVFWNPDDGLGHAWHSVYKDKNGKIVHTLETGGYLEEEVEYKGYKFTLPSRLPCHDISLDVIGLTYEEAIILLAKKVYKNYNSIGDLRKKDL